MKLKSSRRFLAIVASSRYVYCWSKNRTEQNEEEEEEDPSLVPSLSGRAGATTRCYLSGRGRHSRVGKREGGKVVINQPVFCLGDTEWGQIMKGSTENVLCN